MRHVLALCALIVVATGFGGAATRPSLEVQSTDPFRVRGENFGPRELVRVTGTLDGATIWISRRAGPGGRFWALLPDDACTVTVQARGDRGSRASLSFAHVTCRPSH